MHETKFRKIIWTYYRAHHRPMPWRRTRDPYRILVSEIMLQQTQVARVLNFYEKFIKAFPNLRALARANTADVLRMWQGLGYNRRALALQKLAKEVMKNHNGKLPHDRASLAALPGIGPYTAGAIRTFAFDEPEIFIETNVRRVFIHFFFPGRKKVTDAELYRYIERTLAKDNPREWYYALMDYGVMLGKTAQNPNRRSAHYIRQSKFVGSDREIRGKILRKLLARKQISVATLLRSLSAANKNERNRAEKALSALAQEGFVVKNGQDVRIIN